ncbi:uroporphyrinogen-III synthase [Pseudooceanicola sp.]|uniref:uroporphyrinogen-III synthase n=1 Tax=Pseudooceanicola sp. TaxID=1914328 RepID=UPI0035C6A7E7
MRRPTILVTRPAPDGAATAAALTKATGLPVVQSPLVEIATTGPLPDMADTSTLLFTSRNGVRAYADLGGPPRPAVCIGSATAKAARDSGLEARAVGGDAEALIAALLRDPPDAPLLHLRGEVVHTDIAPRLAEAGIQAQEAVIYRQTLLELTAEAQALLADRRHVIVPLYSARTAARLAACASPRAPLHLVAISAAVDRAAGDVDAENRIIADTPDAPSMIRAVLATLRRVEGMAGPH